MRKKTMQGIYEHISNLKVTDEYLLLGDSHVERLIWKFPQFAPSNTWLCGIGGDNASQLSYRVYNEHGNGYTQHPTVTNEFTSIGIVIGTNNISSKMKDEEILRFIKQVECMCLHLNKRWPNAEIKVFPIPPVPLKGRQKRNPANIDNYNDRLYSSGMVAKSGTRFVWNLDLENDFEDDVHLNESGYLKFTNQITNELQSLDSNK